MTKNLWKNHVSKLVLLLCAVFIFSQRFSNVTEREISWDVLGYYTYLPATFIHDDFFLTDIFWLKQEVEKNELSGTLYFISENKKGEPMYFFMMGMAIFFLPWFLMGHLIALGFDYPPNGFSPPYVYSLILGGVVYTLLGAGYLRKILKLFFSDQLVAVLLLVIYFGTNTVHHFIAKDLETVNVLFLLACIVIWNTIRWHEANKIKHLIGVGVGIALMILVKPSEILIGLFPLFYGVVNRKTLVEKMKLIVQHKGSFLLTIVLGLIVLFPQMWYWYKTTGQFIYDSYNNPGVGLDWSSPYVFNVLFSFKKGWLLYTPVMLLALLGFYALYKQHRKLFWPSLVYFILSFYLMSSWTEWWYGSSFSCRPVITLYPILAITMGYFLTYLAKKKRWIVGVVSIFLVGCVSLNQFQWWQLKNYILHDYRMTKAYYMKSFLKTSVTSEDKNLLDYQPDFSGGIGSPEEFKMKEWLEVDFSDPPSWLKKENLSVNDSSSTFVITPSEEWALDIEHPVNEVTQAAHFFLELTVEYRYLGESPKGSAVFVNCIKRPNGTYGFGGFDLKSVEMGQWVTETFRYAAPAIRSGKDLLSAHVWNRSKSQIEFRKLKIDVYEWEE